MSSLINKVKDAISSDHKNDTNTSSTHNDSTTMNTHNNSATEPRTGGTHSAYDTSANTHDSSYTGTHTSGLGQEANRGVDGPGSKTDGPHKSNLMNKLDPRVDSDRDHSKNLGANKGGDATTSTRGASNTTSGAGYTGGPTTTTSSFDPSGGTVATDSDPRINPEMNYSQQSHGTSGLTGTSGTHTGSNNIPEGTYGQHNSRLANAADPRIDSDLDSRKTHQTHQTHQTTHHNLSSGTGGVTGSTRQSENIPEGTYGQHNSRIANAADPRIDSDLDSRRINQHSTTGGAFGSGTTGSHSGLGSTQSGYSHNTENANFASSREPGPAPNTAGPHKSDMLNKADPRVDSNMDGSKTYGGNKTYEQGAAGTTGRDPTDAAQVPPSVLQRNVGEPGAYHEGASRGGI